MSNHLLVRFSRILCKVDIMKMLIKNGMLQKTFNAARIGKQCLFCICNMRGLC